MQDNNILSDLGPLYHAYDWLGIKNQQLPGIFEKNQKAKQAIIASYILHAMAKCRATIDTPVSFAELFCADAYYATLARHFGVNASTGFDNDREGHFENAEKIAHRLGLDHCRFIKSDVNDIDETEQFDIVANVGGLYHVSNPEQVLEKSYRMAKRFLIVQTVVSLANNDRRYFEAPAPGWDWGSRYNPQSFSRMVNSKGWNVVDMHFNELEGNDALENRGSIYYLISKDPPRGMIKLNTLFQQVLALR